MGRSQSSKRLGLLAKLHTFGPDFIPPILIPAEIHNKMTSLFTETHFNTLLYRSRSFQVLLGPQNPTKVSNYRRHYDWIQLVASFMEKKHLEHENNPHFTKVSETGEKGNFTFGCF